MTEDKNILESCNKLTLLMLNDTSSFENIIHLSSQLFANWFDILDLKINFFDSHFKIQFENRNFEESLLDEKIQYLEEQGVIDWVLLGRKIVILDDPDDNLKYQNSKLLLTPVFVNEKIFSLLTMRISNLHIESERNDPEILNFALVLSIILDYRYKKKENVFLSNRLSEISEKLLLSTLSNNFSGISKNLILEIEDSLKIITGNLELVESGIGNVQQRIEIIKKQLVNIKKVNTKIKELNNPEKKDLSRINLIQFINSCISLSNNELNKQEIVVEFKIRENEFGILEISSVESELEKVFLIILMNFKKTLPDGGKVSVVLKIENDKFVIISFLSVGQFIEAVGNDSQQLNNTSYSILETDKLSFIKQVLKRIKGRIDFVSEEQKGLSIKIYLPIFDQNHGRAIGNENK